MIWSRQHYRDSKSDYKMLSHERELCMQILLPVRATTCSGWRGAEGSLLQSQQLSFLTSVETDLHEEPAQLLQMTDSPSEASLSEPANWALTQCGFCSVLRHSWALGSLSRFLPPLLPPGLFPSRLHITLFMPLALLGPGPDIQIGAQKTVRAKKLPSAGILAQG